MQAYAVFYFGFTEIVQIGIPTRIRLEIFRHVLREKNVTGIATSITRCATSIPAPARLARSFTSVHFT